MDILQNGAGMSNHGVKKVSGRHSLAYCIVVVLCSAKKVLERVRVGNRHVRPRILKRFTVLFYKAPRVHCHLLNFIRQGKNKKEKRNRSDEYTLQPCNDKWRERLLDCDIGREAFLHSEMRPHLSVSCACRAKESYFPMCSNGTLT